MQINLCGFSEKSTKCLEKYIDDEKADVVLLSETKVDEIPNIHQYISFLHPNATNPKQKGGSGILIRDSYTKSDRQTNLEKDNVDACFITVNVNGQRLLICSAYIPPNSPNSMKQFITLLENARKQLGSLKCNGLIVGGDFNARQVSWGDRVDNSAGCTLNSFVSQNEMSVLDQFDGNTFMCTNGGSKIDLMLCSDNLLQMICEQVTDPEVELFTGAPIRGHIPVWTMMKLNPTTKTQKYRLAPAWEKTNWDLFEMTMDRATASRLPQLANNANPNTLWENAKEILLSAKQSVIPMKRISQYSKPYWTAELTDLSLKLKQARNNYRYRSDFVNGDKLQTAKLAFSEALDRAKSDFLQNKSQSLNIQNDKSFWKTFKNTFYPNSNNSKVIGDLVDDNDNLVTDDATKAQMLYDSIFKGQHLANSSFDNNWQTTVEKEIKANIYKQGPISLNHDITVSEINAAIKNTKCANKSADCDGIHPLMIKHCGEQFKILLFKIFNTSLLQQHWPWTNNTVIFLRKPGKSNYNITSSYRPITISSYVGKLYERILESRLREFVEKSKVLNDSQNGFRAGRSTATYIIKMLAKIQHDINNKQKIAGIFIDLQKAFDSVWIEGLIYRLSRLNIKGQYLGLMKSFLQNRKIKLMVNSHTTCPLPCSIGVPQGSVIAPLLFCIYIHDMLKDTKALQLQYADDCSLVINANNDTELEQKCQESCRAIDKWLHKWRMQANATKTDLLVFKGNIKTPELSHKAINMADETTVLGLTIDKDLKFSTQIGKARKSLECKWRALYPFIRHGLDIRTALHILKMVIIPKACYLAHLWDTRALLNFHTQIKCILHVPFNPPTECLNLFANVLPTPLLYTKLRLNLVKQLIKISDNSLEAYRKSSLVKIINSETLKFLKWKGKENEKLEPQILSKTNLKKFTMKNWSLRFNNYLKAEGCCTYGLLHILPNPVSFLLTNRSSLENNPQDVGSLCALLSGHSRLQLHRYVLGLTYSPTCICLQGDESSIHYVFDCAINEFARRETRPSIENLNSLLQFLRKCKNKP